MRADRARRLQAVHLRHAHVHEDRIEIALRRRRERLDAVLRDVQVDIELAQHPRDDELIGGVVLRDQDAQRPPEPRQDLAEAGRRFDRAALLEVGDVGERQAKPGTRRSSHGPAPNSTAIVPPI